MIIIAFSGVAGSGKSTATDYLVKHYGFEVVSFADPIKRICRDVFGFSDEQLWGPSAMRNAPDLRYVRDDGELLTPRYALQLLGTDWGRHCHPNIWVDMAMRNARGSRIAIPDCRFINEMDAVRKAGGILWRCKRRSAEAPVRRSLVWWRRALASVGIGDRVHQSERELLELPDSYFNAITDHDGSKDDLYRQIDDIVTSFGTRGYFTQAAE